MPKTTPAPVLLELDNALAARILADPEVAVLLKPFMTQALSLQQAASLCKLPIQTLHYRVRQMLKAGLLVEVRQQARQGRPIRYYQATAQGFQVPLKRVPSSLLESLSNSDSWKRIFERSVAKAINLSKYQEHLRVQYDNGILWWGSELDSELELESLEPSSPAVFNQWSAGLRLDEADAKALQLELWELSKRYHQCRGRQGYVLHLGLAPLAESP